MVSYVPLPVVGGYLGFVGYFCIAGGTALAAGVQVDTLLSWVHLLAADPAIKLVPTAASIAALMLCVEHVSHPLALPGVLTSIPLIFHGVLWAIGSDLQQAQQAGWVMKPTVREGGGRSSEERATW
jgi:SulP family sulfate permease